MAFLGTVMVAAYGRMNEREDGEGGVQGVRRLAGRRQSQGRSL